MHRNHPTRVNERPDCRAAMGVTAMTSPPPARLAPSRGGTWERRSPGPAANGCGTGEEHLPLSGP